jgi:hypothetical protein
VLAPLTVTAVVFPLAGAVCAAGTLWLARIGERRGLIETGEALDEIGLTPEEERELLGG